MRADLLEFWERLWKLKTFATRDELAAERHKIQMEMMDERNRLNELSHETELTAREWKAEMKKLDERKVELRVRAMTLAQADKTDVRPITDRAAEIYAFLAGEKA